MSDVLKTVQTSMSGVDRALANINTSGFDAVVTASNSAAAAVAETTSAATSATSAFDEQAAQTAALSQALQDAARAASEANDNIGDLGEATSDAADETEDLGDESEETAKQTKKLGDQADKNEGIFKRMGGAVAGAAGAVAKMGGIVAGVAGLGGIGVILTKGLDRLTAIDDAKAKLQGLGHTAEGVDTIMSNAMASVKGTAFGLGDAAGVAAATVAAGVKPGQDLERTLKLVGDAATIAGTDINSMGGIFNKIAATGKVSGREMQQLAAAGIPALSLLGDAMGKTSEEVNKMVSAGEVDFATFQDAIEKGMGGAALAGDTFSAATANMGASLGRLGAAILDAPFKAAPSLIGKMTAAVDATTDKVKALQSLLVDGDFNGAVAKAFNVEEDSPFVGNILTARDAFVGLLELIRTGNVGEELARAFDYDMPLLGKLEDFRYMAADWGEQLVNIFGGVKEMFIDLSYPLASIVGSLGEASAAIGFSAWTVFLDVLEALVPIISGILVPAIEKLAKLMNENQAVVTGLVGAFTAYKIAAVTYAAVTNGMAVATKAWTLATTLGDKALQLLDKTMRLSTFGVIVTAITLIVGALTLFFTKTETGRELFQKFKEIAVSVWESIKGGVETAWESIRGVFEAISGWVTETLIPAFKSLWENGIKPAFEAIGNIISVVWENVVLPIFNAYKFYIMEIIVPAVLFLWNNVIMPAFTAIGDIISGVWNNVILPIFNLWKGFIEGILIPIVMFLWNEAIVPAFTGIGNFIKTIWETVISVIFAQFQKGMNIVAEVAKWLYEKAIKPAFDGLGAAISFVYDKVIKPVFDLFVAYINKVGETANWLYEKVIKPSWDAIGDAISFVWENVISPAWDAMMTGLGYVGDFFDKTVEGIGRVWDTLHNILAKPINFMIGTVYNEGIAKAWNKVAEFIPGLAKAPMLDKIPERATGGALYGPGTGTSDDILMWGSNGEHMVTAQEVRNAGGQNVVYAIRDMLARGIPFEWDNGRVINKVGRQNMERYGSRVQDAGGLGKVSPEGMFDVLLPAHKDGGAIGEGIEPWMLQLQKGHEFAKSQHGKPYQWAGPTGPGSSFDCSGFMGSIAAVILGDNPWQRYWATGSFGRGQGAGGPQGFVPGVDGGFTIGVTDDPGGPGGGHTAGTLGAVMGYGPVNVESGGSLGDVHYGGGPSPMSFMGQYHLPIGANGFFQGGSGSGPSPEEQRSWLADKVHDVLSSVTEPIKAGIGAAIGTPPPEYLAIPPKFLDRGVEVATDATQAAIDGLGDLLSSTWAGAQSKVGDVLSFLNPFDSGGVASGVGFMPKNVIAPERVLSPSQTRTFEVFTQALATLASKGDYTAGMRAGGIEEDSPVVDAVLNVREAIIGLGEKLGFGRFGDQVLPGKIAAMVDTQNAAFNEQGELLSDTKSLLERTETSAQKAEDTRHAAVMKALTEVALQLSDKALVPAFEAGLKAGLDSPEADEITKNMGQTIGNISGQLVGASVRSALTGGSGMPAFDSGGMASGLGFMPKATIRPERVLSPRQTEAFEAALGRGFEGVNRGQGVGANAFGANTRFGMFAVDTIVNAIMKVAGIEFKALDTLQNVSKEVRAFRGTAEASFDETGQLMSDTSALLDRTATSAALANSEKDRFFGELIKGTLKFLVTSILIPAIGAVLAGLITAATTAIGTAIAGPVGALVGAAVGAALGGVASIITGALGNVIGSGIDAVFDEGGLASGMGMMPKAIIEPERVLSPRQTASFDRLVDILDKGTNRTTIHAPFTVKGDKRGGEMARSSILSLLNS